MAGSWWLDLIACSSLCRAPAGRHLSNAPLLQDNGVRGLALSDSAAAGVKTWVASGSTSVPSGPPKALTDLFAYDPTVIPGAWLSTTLSWAQMPGNTPRFQ